MRKKSLFLFSIGLFASSLTLSNDRAFGQLLTDKDTQFTQADSLRGGHHLSRKAIDVYFYDLDIHVKIKKKL